MIAKTLEDKKAIILQNHGLLYVAISRFRLCCPPKVGRINLFRALTSRFRFARTVRSELRSIPPSRGTSSSKLNAKSNSSPKQHLPVLPVRNRKRLNTKMQCLRANKVGVNKRGTSSLVLITRLSRRKKVTSTNSEGPDRFRVTRSIDMIFLVVGSVASVCVSLFVLDNLSVPILCERIVSWWEEIEHRCRRPNRSERLRYSTTSTNASSRSLSGLLSSLLASETLYAPPFTP